LPRSGERKWLSQEIDQGQMTEKSEAHPPPPSQGPELVVLWSLRLYLLFMMAVVTYQVWTAVIPHAQEPKAGSLRKEGVRRTGPSHSSSESDRYSRQRHDQDIDGRDEMKTVILSGAGWVAKRTSPRSRRTPLLLAQRLAYQGVSTVPLVVVGSP
jgi:hypothetical protein